MREYIIRARIRRDTNGSLLIRDGFQETVKRAEAAFPVQVEAKNKQVAKEMGEAIARDLGAYEGALIFTVELA